MNDTAPQFAVMVAARHRAMTPEERLHAASDMFDAARMIVESSLPADLAPRERRLALMRRIYGNELPPTAHEVFANYGAGS